VTANESPGFNGATASTQSADIDGFFAVSDAVNQGGYSRSESIEARAEAITPPQKQ
jgi:hypothetical protein